MARLFIFFLLVGVGILGSDAYAKKDPLKFGSFFQSEVVWENHDNNKILLKGLKADITLVGLAYTSCPTICPMTVQNLDKLSQHFKKKGKSVDVIIFTTDPAVDTPAVRKKFLSSRIKKTKGWYFLRASEKETQKVVSKVSFYFKKKTGNSHQMHSLKILGFDREQKLLFSKSSMSSETALMDSL